MQRGRGSVGDGALSAECYGSWVSEDHGGGGDSFGLEMSSPCCFCALFLISCIRGLYYQKDDFLSSQLCILSALLAFQDATERTPFGTPGLCVRDLRPLELLPNLARLGLELARAHTRSALASAKRWSSVYTVYATPRRKSALTFSGSSASALEQQSVAPLQLLILSSHCAALRRHDSKAAYVVSYTVCN